MCSRILAAPRETRDAFRDGCFERATWPWSRGPYRLLGRTSVISSRRRFQGVGSRNREVLRPHPAIAMCRRWGEDADWGERCRLPWS